MENRRDFIQKLSTLSMGLGLTQLPKALTQPTLASDYLPSLKDKKVLMIYGGWPGHEPLKYAAFLKPWFEKEGATVEAHDSLSVYEDQDLMDTIDLVVQIFTMSQITGEQEKGLLNAIKNGTGMAGWHGGMCDAFRQNTNYQYMTGGQWVAHPGGSIEYEVNFLNIDDPLISGLSNFKVTSEQYYMHVDPNVKVLATTKFSGDHDPWIEGCTMPVVWKKYYGNGRIFYTSLGHSLDVYDNEQAFTLLSRGFQWAAGSKYLPKEPWISPVYTV